MSFGASAHLIYHILPVMILSKIGTNWHDKNHRKREISALAGITGYERFLLRLKSQETGAFEAAIPHDLQALNMLR